MSDEEELARVINPDAFADDATELVEDVPMAQAYARLYASRVFAWLEEHDRALSERVWERSNLATGRALLGLLPRNPYEQTE